MWCVHFYENDVSWYFSTRELAEDAVEFFYKEEEEIDDTEFEIYEVTLDDRETLATFRVCGFKPEKYGAE